MLSIKRNALSCFTRWPHPSSWIIFTLNHTLYQSDCFVVLCFTVFVSVLLVLVVWGFCTPVHLLVSYYTMLIGWGLFGYILFDDCYLVTLTTTMMTSPSHILYNYLHVPAATDCYSFVIVQDYPSLYSHRTLLMIFLKFKIIP